MIVGVLQLVQGGFSYDVRTYIGNACSTGPGVFVLAAPFVVIGAYEYLNVAALLLCFLVLRALRRGFFTNLAPGPCGLGGLHGTDVRGK